MNSLSPEVIAATISSIAVILAAFIAKIDILSYIKRSRINLSGTWRGLSLYIPFENDPDPGCIYEITADIKQRGLNIYIEEKITNIYNVNIEKLNRDQRIVKGKGELVGDQQVLIKFKEENSLTVGSMYLLVNSWGWEMTGFLTATNPFTQKPVVVQILLRKSDKNPAPHVTEMAYDDVKEQIAKFTNSVIKKKTI